MTGRLLTAIAALAIAAGPAIAQDATPTPNGQSEAKSAMEPAKADRPMPSMVERPADFVPMAAIGNTFEIQSSNLALQKSKNDDIRAFATKMGEDHSTAANELAAAVDQSKTGTPVPMDLDAPHEAMLRQLEASQSADFDRLYLRMQTKAHDEAIALFQAFSRNGPDGPLKTFASKTLPTLKQHRQMIDRIKVP